MIRYVELKLAATIIAFLITIGGSIHGMILAYYAGQASVKQMLRTELVDFKNDLASEMVKDRAMRNRELDQIRERIRSLEQK
jgi:flavin-dependent dehydrogenase